MTMQTSLSDFKIAFMRGGRVWLANGDGTQPGALTSELRFKADRPLVWSPEGTRLLYVSHSETGWDIWGYNTLAKQHTNLTKTPSGGSRSPAWSPNGQQIAYVRDNPEGLYLMNSDGRNQRSITEQAHRDTPPAWSPDGKRLVYTVLEGSRGLFIVDATGRSGRSLAPDGDQPQWEPRGRRVLYLSRGDLLLVDATSGKRERLNLGGRKAVAMNWSPDGKRIAFLSHADTKSKLFVLRLEDSRLWEPFEFTDPIADDKPAWSPDGRWIACVSGESGKESIYVIRSEGRESRRIATDGARFPAWQSKRG